MTSQKKVDNEKTLVVKARSGNFAASFIKDGIELLSTRETPAAEVDRHRKLWKLLLINLFISIPVLVTFTYNFLIAVDRYASNASFIVRETQTKNDFISLLSTSNVVRSDDSSYAVAAYLTSRDAVGLLNRDGSLERIFGAQEVDYFSYFPSLLSGSTEDDLHKHFQSFIEVKFSKETGITSITVQAFDPEDARFLVARLLQGAEQLVNDVNQRTYKDSIRFAETVVSDASEFLEVKQKELAEFRNAEHILDPKLEIEIAGKVITEIMLEVSNTNALIDEIVTTSSGNKRLDQLKARRMALLQQLAERRSELVGGKNSLATKIAEYESFQLRQKLAETALQNAYASLESASQDAQKNRLYIDQIVQPNVPDHHGYPLRFFNFALVVLICSLMYWIVKSVTNLVSEEL